MRIGLISDLHYGYHVGNKVNEEAVNARESDFYKAGFAAISSLVGRGVDVIVDGGDLAHVPAPKKRALSELIDHVRSVDPLRYLSADGNHTSLKSTADIHVYDIIAQECPNFVGAIKPTVTEEGIALIPHSYDPEQVIRYVDEAMKSDPIMLVGHFAASNIDFDHTKVDIKYLPTNIPVWLGHYHLHTESPKGLPSYIGSTETTAWDQWDFPHGATLFDTETGEVEYIEHETRRFVNLIADPSNYIDVFDRDDLADSMVRLTITATPEQWNTLDTRETRRLAQSKGALVYTQRRAKDKTEAEVAEVAYTDEGITEGYRRRVKGSEVPAKLRQAVINRGVEALH